MLHNSLHKTRNKRNCKTEMNLQQCGDENLSQQ